MIFDLYAKRGQMPTSLYVQMHAHRDQLYTLKLHNQRIFNEA